MKTISLALQSVATDVQAVQPYRTILTSLVTYLAAASCLAADTTAVRFNMRSIIGRTNDLPLTVQALTIPFGSSNYVVTGYPIRLQPIGGTITTNLVPAQYRLTVVGPLPAQTLDFAVTNSAATLDVRDLANYRLSSFSAGQYFTTNISDARYAFKGEATVIYVGDTNTQSGVTLAGTFIGNGAGLTNLQAANIVGLVESSGITNGQAVIYVGNVFATNEVNAKIVAGEAVNADLLSSYEVDAKIVGGETVNADMLSSYGTGEIEVLGPMSSLDVITAHHAGGGAGLTNIQASNIVGLVSGTFSGNGAGLTNLSAGNLATGQVPSARLTGVGLTNAVIHAASYGGVGTNLPGRLVTGGVVHTNFQTGSWMSSSNAVSQWGPSGDAARVVINGITGGQTNYGNLEVGTLAGMTVSNDVVRWGQGIGTSTPGNVTNSTWFGFRANEGNSGSSSSGFGYLANYRNSGASSVGIGYYANFQNSGNYSTGVGLQANFLNSGGFALGIGYLANYLNSGSSVVSVGHQANRFNGAGVNNVSLGTLAGYNNRQEFVMNSTAVYQSTNSPWSNYTTVAVAAVPATIFSNVTVYLSGAIPTTNNASWQVVATNSTEVILDRLWSPGTAMSGLPIVGWGTLNSRNTFLGSSSGANVSHSVGSLYVGNESGPSVSSGQTNRLYISNTHGTPLIGGSFTPGSRIVEIDGTLTVNNDVTLLGAGSDLLVGGQVWATNGFYGMAGGLSNFASSVIHGTNIIDGSLANADLCPCAAIADSKLAAITSPGKVANSATTANSYNSALTLVARSANGWFSSATVEAGVVNTTTPAFRSVGTNVLVMVSTNGSSWILQVSGTGGLYAVTNTAGL